jgi:pimeloyl-ACP methyl ester carboxylesterase
MAACCLFALVGASLAQTESAAGTMAESVIFQSYSSYSTYGELARRLMSATAATQIGRQLAAAGASLSGQPIDLAAENFSVYVPAHQPEEGYGLLVFVPPWQRPRLPAGWERALDQHGVIFVSAARSGNEENTMGRREPLALLAAHNVMSRYPVDARRVYIGGFSGGSRVALRLALGYPDLFRGAFLNAGSDVIGDPAADPPIPLPPRELLYRFQDSSHVVYVTGARDSDHLADDQLSVRSLHHWCVFGTDVITVPQGEHEVANGAMLSSALRRLVDAQPPDPARLARCRATIEPGLSPLPQ